MLLSVSGMTIPLDRNPDPIKEAKMDLVNEKVETLELTTQKLPAQSNLNESKQVPINYR